MRRSEERRYRQLFSTKRLSPMYRLFYRGNAYRQKDGGEVLLSKRQVFDALGIDTTEMSASEKAFIDSLWRDAIKRMKDSALERMQPWGCLAYKHANGETVWMHGYTTDPAKQEAMRSFTHWQAINLYRSEKRQQLVFNKSAGIEDEQLEFPIREPFTSFETA